MHFITSPDDHSALQSGSLHDSRPAHMLDSFEVRAALHDTDSKGARLL